MNVLVRGGGNLGTTLTSLLLRFQGPLGIARITLEKSTPKEYDEPDLALLGAHVVRGRCPLDEIDYVFDCRRSGAPRASLEEYRRSAVRGSAQGSEKGFGVPFMSGVRDAHLPGERFVQIASCNTHAIGALLMAVAGRELEALESSDFVVVRRSDDLSNRERLVGANVVSRHLDESLGTHHAIDVVDLFRFFGVEARVLSSDITTPSQLMHSVRFRIRARGLSKSSLLSSLEASPLIATTGKFDSNRVFELGRRYGAQGRLFAHAIVVTSNLLFTEDEVIGWAFVPQEGNTLLSTMHAFLAQVAHPMRDAVWREVRDALVLRSL